MPTESEFSFGPFRLLPLQRVLLDGDRPLHLGSRAFDLLVALTERAGEIVPAAELLARVWPNSVVDAGSLRVHIAALRKSLGDGLAGQRYITNVPLRGYCLVAPVVRTAAAAGDAPIGKPASTAGLAEPSPVRPRSLPPPVRLLGRDSAVAEIEARLRQRRCVTIVGPGGIGKTALALAIADRQYAHYRHQAVFLDLTTLADPALVPTVLATALGIALDPRDPMRVLVGYLRDKQMLIVIDNCEHLIDATAAFAEQLLKVAPQVHVLATSREALRIEGEAVQRLAPLDAPVTAGGLSSAEAQAYPAVQLFIERASAGLDSFVFGEAEVPAVCEICRRLDGIPLAIELAAASVDALGVQGIAQHLADRLSLLTHGRRTALPRHQTLRATLDWSFELLAPPEQAALARLSVFRSPFPLESAVAICADPAERGASGGQDVTESIYNLVAKSRLSVDASGDAMQYRLLESTRAYAQERLVARGEVAAIARRHAEHFRDVFTAAESAREQRPPAVWLATHGRRIDDLRAAGSWAFGPSGDAAIGVALAATSAPLWFALSLMAEYRVLAETALAALEATDAAGSTLAMQLHEAYGHALWHTRGGGPAMQATFTRALELAEQHGAVAYQLRSVWGLWLICNTVGDYAGSVRLAERFGQIAGPTPPTDVGLTHDRMMALGLHYGGDQARAVVHARRVLEHPVTVNHAARGSGFQFDQRVSALTVLARILWVQGQPDAALDHARLAVEESLSIGHTLSLCYAIANGAAPVAFWAGDITAARRYTSLLLERASERSLDFWLAFGEAFRYVLLLRDLAPSERPARPLDALQNAAIGTLLRETLSTIDPTLVDEALLGRAEGAAGSWCGAEMLRVKAIWLMARLEAPGDEAEALLHQGIQIARRQHALAWELRCSTSLARRWHGQGRRAEAHGILRGVLDRYTQGWLTADVAAAKDLLAELAPP